MEQFNDNENNISKRTSLYEAVDGMKSFISTFLGVFVALLIGIALVFVISSLEGTKRNKGF